MEFNITTINGEYIVSKEDLEAFAITVYSELQAVSQLKRDKVMEYVAELNGNSIVPDPDNASGSWRTNLKSSIFFQKTIFAYLYLRALLQKSTDALLTFKSNTYTYLPSAYRKIFNLGVYKTKLFDKLDRALWYGILSGELTLLLDADYVVDEWDDVEFEVIGKALNPLNYYKSADGQFYAYDTFQPIEVVKGLSTLWKNPPEKLEPYNLTTNKDITDYLITSIKDKATYGKITYIFGRYVSPNFDIISLPLKLTLYNDKYLVDVETITHIDKRLPIISVPFYSDDMQLSYVDLIWDYYKEDSRFLRAIIDRAILATTMGFEINVSALDKEQDVFTVKPFAVIRTVSDEPAIKPFSMATFDPNVLPVRQLIVQESQNISAITEFLMGLPTSKGRPTAKEVAIKTQMSQQIISTIINRIEDQFISSVARKLLTLMFQYHLSEILNSSLLTETELKEINGIINKALLEDKEPYYYLVKELYKGTEIKVEGMSGVIKQKDEVENIMNMVEMATQLGLTPFLNMPEIFKKLFKALQLDSDLVRIPPPEELKAMAQVQQAQTQIEPEIYSSILQQMMQSPEVMAHVAGKPQALSQYVDMLAQAKAQQIMQQQQQGAGND
ncbi:TPA: portal protein [Aquificae Joseph's Coat Spring virus]|nr:TPA: portal protein [Aquificae Joseph's Coat Spring virus]